jgi:hypothetical protein
MKTYGGYPVGVAAANRAYSSQTTLLYSSVAIWFSLLLLTESMYSVTSVLLRQSDRGEIKREERGNP